MNSQIFRLMWDNKLINSISSNITKPSVHWSFSSRHSSHSFVKSRCHIDRLNPYCKTWHETERRLPPPPAVYQERWRRRRRVHITAVKLVSQSPSWDIRFLKPITVSLITAQPASHFIPLCPKRTKKNEGVKYIPGLRLNWPPVFTQTLLSLNIVSLTRLSRRTEREHNGF